MAQQLPELEIPPLPPLLEELKKRWEQIEEKTGISLIEFLFGLFTPLDDLLKKQIEILERIEKLLMPAPPAPVAVGVPEIPLAEEVERIPIDIPEIGPVQVPIEHIFATLLEPDALIITFPSEGGTLLVDTAGRVKVDLVEGTVTLPDNTTRTIRSLKSIFVEPEKRYVRSLIIETSKDSIVDLGREGYRFTIPAGIAVPLHKLSLQKFDVTVSANTYLRFVASTRDFALPNILNLKTQEYYTEQFREKVTVDTGGTEVTISPAVKQVIVYTDGDAIYVEFNGSIDADSFKIPDGGSLTYPFLTESIALKATTGTADVYIRGLR